LEASEEIVFRRVGLGQMVAGADRRKEKRFDTEDTEVAEKRLR
jgi:hypothetical protein